jgi:hypothetical protein
LGLKCLGGLLDEVDDEPMLRFETAAFGLGQPLGGNLQGGEVDEGLAGTLQALLDVSAQRREHRRALRVGPDDRHGVGQ